MAASTGNFAKVVNRTREAARNLAAALEEARECNREFIRLGGNVFTDKFFYVNGDTAGALRTDLDITKTDLVNAQIGLDAIEAQAHSSGYQTFLDLVK